MSPALRVLVALRYYAGASYLDVCDLAGLAPSNFYDAVWTFTDAVISTPELQMSMPVWDAAWRRRTAAGFQRRSDSPLRNIIGSLDGIAVRQERPTAAEVTCTKDYWSRKGFFAYNVQAICDSNYEFLWMSFRTPGSSCDSSALAWDVKDDPVDSYTPATSGDRLSASHNWVASLSDGWCTGPISTDDRGVAMDWSRISRVVGVNYQTYDAASDTTAAAGQWTFAADEPGGPGGSIDAYGRKAWGGVVPTVTVRGVCSCP